MRINQTLAAMYRARRGGAEPPAAESPKIGSTGSSRARARRAPSPCVYEGLPAEAAETLETFRTIARMRDEIDREAFGALILSMTRSAADILGVYLLAKEGGLFADTAAVERCTLPIVPLLETIPDLRRARAILKELLDGAAGAAQPVRAGQDSGGDDRLLRLEQGRRLSHRALGARQSAEQPDPPRTRAAA